MGYRELLLVLPLFLSISKQEMALLLRVTLISSTPERSVSLYWYLSLLRSVITERGDETLHNPWHTFRLKRRWCSDKDWSPEAEHHRRMVSQAYYSTVLPPCELKTVMKGCQQYALYVSSVPSCPSCMARAVRLPVFRCDLLCTWRLCALQLRRSRA